MADAYFISASIIKRQGKWEEALKEFKIALKLDPLNYRINYDLNAAYGYLHEYDNSIELWRKYLNPSLTELLLNFLIRSKRLIY